MTRKTIAWTCLALSLAGSAAAFKITPKKGIALRLIQRKDLTWKAPAHLPTGAEYHLIHEDPDTHGIQAIARFSRGYTIPEHTHTLEETIVVLKGKLWINAAGVEKVLKSGEYAFIPAGVPHTMTARAWFGKTWTLTTTPGPYNLTYTQK